MVCEVASHIVAESESFDRRAPPGVIEEVPRGDPSPCGRIRWDVGHETLHAVPTGTVRTDFE